MSFIQVVSIKAKHIQLTWLLESWYNFNLNTPIDSTLKNQSKVFGNPPIRSNIFVLNFNKHNIGLFYLLSSKVSMKYHEFC